MNKYDKKLVGMDEKTAKAFGSHLNAAMGQGRAQKNKKTTEKKKKS